MLQAMEADAALPLGALKVDGGAAANSYLLQTQADINGCDVIRPKCVETTAMGAAYLAGLAVGFWKDLDEIRANWAIDRSFTPEIDAVSRAARLSGWHKAVACAKGWEK